MQQVKTFNEKQRKCGESGVSDGQRRVDRKRGVKEGFHLRPPMSKHGVLTAKR